MKYLANDGSIFDNSEDCLRYEGACDARGKGGGCLVALMGMVAFAVWVLSNIG